jgi:hypothetical protein
VFHVEVRQFPNVARTFNLSEAELNDQVLVPWTRGQLVKLGEHEWEPARAKLKILEGRELRGEEMGIGRGWSNVTRYAEDVTERLLAAARAAGGAGADSGAAAFKEVLCAQCASSRLAVHQVMWLANSRHPEWRVSDRLALAERAVWELLHEGRLTMFRRVPGDPEPEYEVVDRSQWQPALLTWATWSDPAEPLWVLAAAE